MGINIGAVLAPLVCGYMAQGAGFKSLVARMGYDPSTSWHWAFGAAGVGMTLGLVIYLASRRRLAHVGARPAARARTAAAASPAAPLTPSDWKRIGAIFVFFLFTILFWAAYEQKGASLNLFALHLVRNEIFGLRFPSSWLQSLTPFFVILLAPIFSVLWVKMGRRQPTSPMKFVLGLTFIGLAYVLLVPGAALTAQGRISPLWLVGLYFLEVAGEMCSRPVGLSTVTKLSPARLVGIMMGVWFLAAALGNKLAGFLSGFFVANDAGTLVRLYGGIAAGLLLSAAILALLRKKVEALMGQGPLRGGPTLASSGGSAFQRPGCEHRRHPLGIPDALVLHPGVRFRDERPALRAAHEHPPAAAGRGGVERHSAASKPALADASLCNVAPRSPRCEATPAWSNAASGAPQGVFWRSMRLASERPSAAASRDPRPKAAVSCGRERATPLQVLRFDAHELYATEKRLFQSPPHIEKAFPRRGSRARVE